MSTQISEATTNRLSVYLRCLNKLDAEGIGTVSSKVLADRFEFGAVISRNKGNASRPCPADILDEMAEQCDVVITASGD